ncbi:hypothetical protein M0812_00027 [Anaeramoeba flamelloides]|uniref:BTB domain-containing protein n=1 Tax=Anaeramoeba flamelloides TaxID=1746091 RepID=A0AAV8A4V2_9EUKA|nr:hypothetical protein M0812_00027 [Anaeramoeba flamelloides]
MESNQEKDERAAFLLKENTNSLQKINVENVKQGCGGNANCLVLNNRNEIYRVFSSIKKILTPKNEIVKKIAHGFLTGLILTMSGKVYTLGNSNSYQQLPLKNLTGLENDRPYLVEWFLDRDIQIKDINCASITNYFISTDNVLYTNGYNSDGQMGVKIHNNKPFPQKIQENVDRVFTSPHAHHSFFTTLDNKLMGFGRNAKQSCGLGGSFTSTFVPTAVPKICGFEVKNIICTSSSSLLFKNGQVWTTGTTPSNGLSTNTYQFEPLPGLENIRIVSIGGGTNNIAAISDMNEIYVWGTQRGNYRQMKNTTFKGTAFVNKLFTPSLAKSIPYKIGSTPQSFVIIPDIYGNENLDGTGSEFFILFEKGKFTDYNFLNNQKFKIHKKFVEFRINKSIEEIEKALIDYDDQKIIFFLEWVYSGKQENYLLIKEICQKFGVENLYNLKFQDALLKLFKDEDSKNFNVLIKNDFDDEEEEEEEDEGEGEESSYEEIPVHKYILYARSGLFREMFDKIDENSNSIKDYSGKTIESLEILIKYLYTNKIELTADDDPELVVEELNDAVDYYQLDKFSNLPYLLRQIKNKLL